MRIVRYSTVNGQAPRLGALVEDERQLVDLQAAAAALLKRRGDPLARGEAELRLPENVASLIAGGEISSQLMRDALHFALAVPETDVPIFLHSRDAVRLHAPLRPPLIICGGGNFQGHLVESGREKPDHVEFFLKSPGSVLGPEDDIPYAPSVSQKLDYEAELGIVIGKGGFRISRERALDHVFGYTAVNDLAIRDRQLRRWEGDCFHIKYGNGKIFDGNLVLGPSIVTTDEIRDPMALSITCRVDGEVRQDSNTSQYIWGIAEVIEYYSSMMTLEPGFLICPGTPGGCAVGTDPACGGRTPSDSVATNYLVPGQMVEVEIGQIGQVRNRVSPSADRSCSTVDTIATR